MTPHQSEVVAMVESAGELSLALRSIAENDGKTLAEDMPQLAAKYDDTTKRPGGDTLFLRYGIENYTANK